MARISVVKGLACQTESAYSTACGSLGPLLLTHPALSPPAEHKPDGSFSPGSFSPGKICMAWLASTSC